MQMIDILARLTAPPAIVVANAPPAVVTSPVRIGNEAALSCPVIAAVLETSIAPKASALPAPLIRNT